MARHYCSGLLLLLLVGVAVAHARHVEVVAASSAATTATTSGHHAHARAMKTVKTYCKPGECNPDEMKCIYWSNPCPYNSLYPTLPRCVQCGTCVQDYDEENGYHLITSACPVVSCASSFALSLSRNKGCASAKSTVTASATSVNIWKDCAKSGAAHVKQFLAGETRVEVAAAKWVQVFAKGFAAATASACQQLCFCCKSQSTAVSDVRAAAKTATVAMVSAMVESLAAIQAKDDDVLQDWYATAEASATSIAAHVDEAFAEICNKVSTMDDDLITKKVNKKVVCTAPIAPRDVEIKISNAMVCAAVSVFAGYYNSNAYDIAKKTCADPSCTATNIIGVSESCASTYAVSFSGLRPKIPGVDQDIQCHFNCQCKGCAITKHTNDGCGCDTENCIYKNGKCTGCTTVIDTDPWGVQTHTCKKCRSKKECAAFDTTWS